MTKNRDIRVRVDDELRARLDAAAERSVHKLTLSQIVERGLILALDELDRIEAREQGRD